MLVGVVVVWVVVVGVGVVWVGGGGAGGSGSVGVGGGGCGCGHECTLCSDQVAIKEHACEVILITSSIVVLVVQETRGHQGIGRTPRWSPCNGLCICILDHVPMQ